MFTCYRNPFQGKIASIWHMPPISWCPQRDIYLLCVIFYFRSIYSLRTKLGDISTTPAFFAKSLIWNKRKKIHAIFVLNLFSDCYIHYWNILFNLAKSKVKELASRVSMCDAYHCFLSFGINKNELAKIDNVLEVICETIYMLRFWSVYSMEF